MNIKTVKVVSAILTIVSVGINLAASALSDRILDDKIECKVSEALANKN